jgi:hypothetical protein
MGEIVEKIKNFVLILAAIIILSIPAIFPEFFIVLSIVVWPIVIFGIYVYSWFHNIHSDILPLTIYHANDVTFYAWASETFVMMLLGMIVNGIRGIVAMFLFYAPMNALRFILIALNLAVINDHGMTGYEEDNYDSSCKGTSDYCTYVPKSGLALVTFKTNYDMSIMQVIPYGKTVSDVTSGGSNTTNTDPADKKTLDKLDAAINELNSGSSNSSNFEVSCITNDDANGGTTTVCVDNKTHSVTRSHVEKTAPHAAN